VRELLRQRRVTKIPVHDGGLDRILGFLHVKRYLARRNPPNAGRAVAPAVYVPELADLESLIDELRRKRVSLAIVVDEYGGTAGLVALEDALRPLLSDTVEPGRRHTTPDDLVRQLGPRTWRLPGRLRIRDWVHVLGPAAQAPGVTTLAGLVVSRLGRFPRVGDSVSISNLRFRVEEVRGLRVEVVRVDIVSPAVTAGDGDTRVQQQDGGRPRS
jgi:CBS domain containing-hemolysin-like protein